MNLIQEVLYRRMLTVRLLEDRLFALCKRGEAGDLHFSKGQEAISVGVCDALASTDWIICHHRTIAHQVARGADLYPLVAELLGKRTGVNGGRAGEMHIHDEKIRHAFSFQLVGTCVAVAAGFAWAKKREGNGEVVACFFGDAASSNGAVHEGLNLAALHKLPMLLICENNEIAGNITPEYYLPTKTVAERMRAYDIPAMTIDGNDIEEVREYAHRGLGMVRSRGGPVMIECMTARMGFHKMGMGDVRTKEQHAAMALRDPLNKIPAAVRVTMEAEIGAVLDAVFARVAADPAAEWRLE